MANFGNKMATWLLDWLGGDGSKVVVNANTALMTAPIWYGINKISGNIGMLPLDCKRDLNPGAEIDTKHIAYRLLRLRPNRYQTPFVFKQTLTQHAIMWGNGRAYIHRAGNNSELIPLRPDATITGMVDGEKWHLTKPERDDRLTLFEDIDKNNGAIMLPDADVLHIQGFGEGICGMSLFQVAKNSLTISIAAEKNAERQMTKGFAGKVMLEAPAESAMFRDAKQAEEFMKDFKTKHGADGAADEVGLLRGGVKANVLQMSNKDAEFIEQRKFQRQEAALWLMLESILGDDNSVSYNSEEQKQLAYLKNCLANWLVRWEEETEFKLLTPNEFYNGSHFMKFNVATLLRTDTATAMDTFTKAIAARIYNPNEVRNKLDENPYEGGDTYFNPAITPGDGQSTSKETETNAAMVSRLEHLLKIEQKRVNEFMLRGDTHEQIEKWYAGWCETLGDAIEQLGGDRTISQTHCVNNLKYLERSPKTFDLSGTSELIAKEIRKCLI